MKFLRYLKKKRRAMLALAALTFFSNPFAAQASNITTKDGQTLNPTDNVYNIKVQKELSNQVGVNKFTDFNLDSGHIANMQFGNLQTLANLVDNKININGTVNALRNGKIGGNLYFLSPNGIAVGSTGVINAGAFTGMAVDKDYFDKLGKIESAGEFMTALSPKNIVYNNDLDKGIDIQGVINAPGGISLYATKIDIGEKAVLRTNVSQVDFSKVVNITSDSSIEVDSGITGGLDASYKNGDIILKARAEHIADDNDIKNRSGDTASTKLEKVTEREAVINVDGTIKSAGDVSINAESEIKFTEGSYWNIVSQTGIADAFLGSIGLDCSVDFAKKDNVATVNIGKTADIYSKGDMDISATSTLNVKINATTPASKTGTTSATDWIPATSVALISATNKAAVNIDGKLQSEGTMAINAAAKTSLSATAKTATYVGKSAGDKGVKEDSNYIAISIIDGETSAEVNINSGDEIKVGGKDSKDAKAFEATATTDNSISNSAAATTKATSKGSSSMTGNDDVATTTAVNVTDYSATANVNVNRSITAENGGINLDATNTIENEMSASTITGREVKPMEDWSAVSGPDFLNAISNNLAAKATSSLQKATSNVPDEGGGSTLSKIFDGEYFKTGVTVGVFLQDNDAKVSVGNDAALKAKKDIDISATNKIESLSLAIDSTVNNQTSAQKSPVMIGLGVLVSDINNNSDIVVDGSLNSVNGDISLKTDAGMNYNQFEAVTDGIKEAFEEIAEDTKNLGEDVYNTFSDYDSQVSDELDKLEKIEDPEEYMEALDNLNEKINDTKSTGFDSAVKSLDDGVKLKKDLENLPSALTSFLAPSSYANYYALSAFVSGSEGNEDTKLEAAGAFSINSMLNNSRIVVGDNSVISAEKGTVNTNSLAQNRVVAITGMGGPHLTSSEAKNNGAGVSVMVGDFQNNAVVAVGKNSDIKAKDIKLETKDYAKHVNIIYGNGKADSTSITGMVSYINSPANSILSLDDSTKLNASGNVELNALSENYITSVNGGITMGNGGGKSFGAAINILNNDGITAVAIADNGVNSKLKDTIDSLQSEVEIESEKDSPDQNILVDKKSELKTLKITKAAQDILGEDYTKKLGDASTDNGEITADNFTTKSENTGTINAIAVEGTENSESHGFADQFNDKVYKGEVQLGYAENAFKWPSNKLSKTLGNDINDKFKSGQKNSADASKQAGNAAGNDNGGAGEDAGVNNNVESQLNVAGAGSAAINIKSGETGSFISNSKITANKVEVTANDDAFHGSWAGAGAFNFFGKSQAAENTNVAIGGAVAYSDNSKNVDAIIKNSTVNAAQIKNIATRDDSDVSAGMGLAVSTNKGDQGTNVDVAISASINFIEGDTHALLLNNTVKGGSIENKAAIDSLQVAGGLDIAGSSSGGKGFNLGGAAAASKITNDLQSGIKGGSYENLGNVDITANKKSNQIDVAVAGGITTGSGAKGFSFGGAVAVSDINNNSRAFLDNTTKFNSSGVVNVDARDTKNENSRSSYLSSRSINTDPTSFLADGDKGKVDGTNGGGNIVNVAFGAGGSTSDAAAGGLGISYAGISNLVNVDISDNQNISAQNLNANTTNKSNIVNVTVGLAGSNKSFSAAGSFGVSDILNDGTINISNSNATADSFLSNTQSNAHIVNVAGQASLASKFSGGLTFAYNAMNNTTGINVKGGTWNVKDFGATANNDNYALAIGAGVGFSKNTGALNGAIGLNLGNNSTKSIVDGTAINNVENLKVTATDNTSKTTIAGDVVISKDGKVAAGGSVAYADIGTSDNKEVINAKVTNAEISARDNSTVDVEALDNATMTTVAVGVGGALSGAKVTFQGAAAVSELNKENLAEISNSNISNNADVKIIATSGGNSSDGLKIDGATLDVNNKVNTAAAVLDVNFSSDSLFDGALAISVNNFNQSTEANFKGNGKRDTGKVSASQVGNANIYSNSEADILGVALGGAGGKSKVGAAGSVSYNYIDNSAKSLVENANVKADKNFGVVAQSDDKIANYAGAVNVDVDGYASIGVSVAYNEIKGNTDANIKNSNLEVTGSDSDLISVSNPKDNLIDDYVTKNTWTSGGLFDGRTTDKKSGLVVNSSATHSISSDLATIGIRASSDKPGVGASGTVNINKIGGATMSRIQDSEVGIQDSADTRHLTPDTYINAADYTNNGSFIGNAAISGTVAIGMLWNENQIERETNSLVKGGTLNVKNLDVTADSRQGLSNLNIAVGAAFTASQEQAFAASSGDNVVRNQLEGTTTAKIENATVNHSGNVNVDAYHKDNAFATNLAVGAAIDTSGAAGATFDLGYGLLRENSTVEAEINNSTLKSDSGAVNVNAENDSKMAGAFGTMGAAVHAGNPGVAASVALGINNNYVTNNVRAGIKGSTLNVGAVDVNAKNSSEIKADGGVAAVAINLSESFFASLGAAVAVTNATFDNKVTAEVDSSTINATGDVNINARDDHKSDETVVSAALSTGLSVSVNRMSTSVNSGLADLKKDALGKTLSAGDLVMNTDNASKSNANSDSDKLNAEYGDEHFLNDDALNELLGDIHTDSKTTKDNINATLKKRHTATVNYNNSLKNGVFANVTNSSTIDAGTNKISIGSTENNDLSITSGSGSAGLIGGIGVGSTSIKTRRANTANVIGSTLKAKDIDISTTNGQTGDDGILSKMYNATLSPLGVSVGYNNVETNGSGEINISDAKITAADKINATAVDKAKSKSYILDAGIKQIGYTGVFAYNTNTSQTGIKVGNSSTLDAKAFNFDAKNQTHRATDTLAISVSGTLGIQTSTSEAKDESKNFITVEGAGNKFTATEINFNALNGGQTYANTNGQAYLGLNAVVANAVANSETAAQIDIADGNHFLSDKVNISAQIGEDGKYTAEANGFAINGSTVGVNIDDMTAKTKSAAQISIGNEFYNEGATLNVTALNKASRNSFMRNNAYALVANANDISAYTIAEDKSSITVGNDSTLNNSNKLAALNISSDTENKSYVAAKGTGGAIGGDFGSAAHADNSVDNTSEATLKGTWNIANDLTLSANQHDETYISGYSARGAILTGGKGSLDNVIKGSTTATISDAAQIYAKTVNVNSKNYIKTDKYSGDYDYTLFGRMGGVVDDVDYQRSSATTNKSANINVGNAAITTTGKQTYDALNDYDLKNDVYAEGGSLLASLRWVKSHNYITANENINVGKGATLKNEGGTFDDGGITFAAHDNLELNPGAKGFSQAGAGGYVRAETLIDLNRKPTININGTLKSAKDLNLYAGADTDGNSSKVHSYAKAISQVMTLVSDGSADIIRKGTTNSNVNINSGAYGQAAHDVNIISNAGYEVYEERPFYGSTWSSTGEYKVATADTGNLTTADYTHNNKVKVDGELKAANTPDVTINISGVALPDDFILADDNLKNLSYSVKSGEAVVSKKNTNFTGKSSEEIFAQQIYNGITTSTTKPEDSLLPRYKEVCESISNYYVQGKGDVVAYNGFLQEKLALEEEMVNLGMGSYSDSGEFSLGTNSAVKITTLVLPDVEVSGGSINISTDNFSGSGKLNASGVPKIDVENNSTAYLVTKKLTIADKGGAINYNGTDVTDNAAINSLNSSKSGASFSDMKVADGASVPTITVSNNYAGQSSILVKPNPKAEDYKDLPDDAKTEIQKYLPVNYIELTGDVTNPVGKATINNKQGSIRVNKGATVNAMDIEMTAKESISQGYTDSIVNIAYNPKDAYKSEAANLREKIGWDKTMPTSDQIKNEKSDWTYKGGSAWEAGNAIYISARDININGLVQAGYSGFAVTITQADINNAKETTFFNGTTMYKVNDGGAKLDNNGYYVYEPQVYYDKTNNKLYVEDINAVGGKIYLAGRISSTGNGKIVVSDGANNIDITNTSSADMNVGKVTSAGGGGFIQIADSEQDRLTEYSSGKTRTIENYSAWLADKNQGKVTEGNGISIGQFVNYNPKSGLSYRWTEGTQQEDTIHYYYKEEKSWWGLSGDDDYTSNLAKLSETVSRINDSDKAASWHEERKNEPVAIGNGIYIGNGTATSDNFTLLAQNVKTNESYGNHTSDGPHEHGLGGFYEDYDHRWTKTTGSKQIYQYALKADYPISVGIIGETGTPSINLSNTNNSSGDLYLTGNIRNDNGNLNITSNGGDIIQEEGVKISTDNINLTAMNHIKNIDVVNHRTNTLNLKAQSVSKAGDIDINVSGGIRDNQPLNGSVVVEELSSKNGDVTLKAQGNIRQETDGTTITARNIKLESANGYINLKIESNGQNSSELSAISAAANGDIKLVKNDSSDFLIGSIVSTTGDVELNAGGKFVDALDKVRDNADSQESDLIKLWIDMGLIAGTDDYKGAYINRLEHDRDNYKADVTEQFTEYKNLLDEYNALHERFSELEKGDRLTTLEKKFASYETADEYLAADSDYQTLVATVANPQYQWTEDELLSGIRSAIVNKQEGTASDVTRLKDANITARNVTLTGTGVGTNSKKVTTIKMSELRAGANETNKQKTARLEKLSKLANVEAADVKINYVLDDDGNPISQTIERVNYNYDADNGYYIDKADNYIRYRKDADGNLLKYTYKKDGDDFAQVGEPTAVSDFSDVIKSTELITNKEIDSFEISGTIPLGINATGNLTVKTTGNDGIYIAGRNKGVKITETTNPNNNAYSALNINQIETTKTDGNFADVRIIGEAGIFNAASSGENVIGKDLVLVGGNGAIGTQAKPFTVRLTGDLLSARANEEINLSKVGDDDFRISAIYSQKDVRITNDANGRIQRSLRFDETAESYINTPGTITINGTAGTASDPMNILPHTTTILNLRGDNDSEFYIKGVNDGTINLNDTNGKVDISSEGSVKQTATGTQNPSYLKVSADGDIILDRASNAFDEIYVGKIGGKFEFRNNSDSLKATFTEESNGKFTINQRGDIELAGAVSGSELSLTSEKGNIISTGGLKATDEIKLSSATFNHIGEIHTGKLTIETDNGVTINNTENTFSELEISSRDGKAINGSINVAIKADKFAPTIKNDVTGDVTLKNTKKNDGLLSFGDGETINIGGNFVAETNGDFEYGSTLLAGKDININSRNVYRREGTTGYFSSPGKITFNVNAGNKIGTAENPVMIANSAEKTSGLTIYGETHIKGVNDGVLTLGDVFSDNDVSISSEGSIVQADDKKISVKKITIAAAKEIILDNKNNIIENLVLDTLNDTKNSGGIKINVDYSTDDLTLGGNLKTSGDVDITSYKSLVLNGAIESDKNIALTSNKNIIGNEDGVLKAGEQITLKADDVKLAGKVETPSVDVTIKNGLEMNNSENIIKSLDVRSTDKTINGSVSATGNVEFPDEEPEDINLEDYIFSTRILNDINKGNLTLKSNGIVSLRSINENALLGTLTVKGNVTLDTDLGFITGRIIRANKDINITSRNGGILIVNLTSNEGNEVLKALRNVNLNAAENIDVDGQITAGDNITINSDNGGIDIFGEAQLFADEDIKLTAGEGDININGSVSSYSGNVAINIDKGNLNIEELLEATNGTLNRKTNAIENGEIHIKIGEGNIQIGNETTKEDNETVLEAKRVIDMRTDNGTITISGKIESAQDITMTTDKSTSESSVTNFDETDLADDSTGEIKKPGAITIDAEIEAGNSIYLMTDDGDIDITKPITVTDGTILLLTVDGNIRVEDNGADNMLSAQKEVDILTTHGAITIAGKVSTQDGDIKITTREDSYTSGQENIKVEGNGAINSGKDIYLNLWNGDVHVTNKFNAKKDIFVEIRDQGNVYFENTNANGSINATTEHGKIIQTGTLNAAGDINLTNSTGDIELDTIKAENANIKAINGDVTADTIMADDTIRIELENGDLYLNLARSKGVVILADENSKQSSVNTIRANSVQVDRNLVKVRSIISSKNSSGGISGGGGSGGGSYSQTVSDRISNLYSDRFINTFSDNIARNGSTLATLGTASTRSGSGLTTYWQDATSAAQSDYSFSEFDSTANDMSYRLTRNYFEVRFIPTWLEKEFLDIDFEFDYWGLTNSPAREITLSTADDSNDD